jgi:hypothetical protein
MVEKLQLGAALNDEMTIRCTCNEQGIAIFFKSRGLEVIGKLPSQSILIYLLSVGITYV